MEAVRLPKDKSLSILLIALLLFCVPCPAGSLQSRAAASDQPPTRELIREPILAGSWYPESATELSRQIEEFLSRVPATPIPGRLTTLVAPHGGYTFSGQVAAYAYKALENQKFQTVIVIAPSHHVRFQGVSVYDRGGFRTPLGVVPLDKELIAALEKHDDRIHFVPGAHAKEHALEIQLPFLQTLMPDFKLVPLVMGEQDFSTCQWLAEALVASIGDKSVLVVASSDLSHYHQYEEAKKLDQNFIDRLNAFDSEGLSVKLKQGHCEACGGGPIVTAMLVARGQGALSGRVLHYANSGDIAGGKSSVVGYAAAALWKRSALKSETQPTPPKAGIDMGLTAEERVLLHRIVKETIEAQCLNQKPPQFPITSPFLKEPRGAFVTLHKHAELRGCIGKVMSSEPLAETVAEMAVSAAFRDPRFPAVTADELKDLDYEISVLTPSRQIKDVNEIEVGVHGILMKKAGRTGLLLPQVATQYGWDRTAFLENTCQKASLPKDAWKDEETEIYIFSADVF